MKINKLKINSYGKLKNKEIEFKNNINIVYGKNESGKSTLLKFIQNSFYGISKNKKGKEYSDFDKYSPWAEEEFSGKLEYELDNNEKYEIYRDFKKKNPKIFNEKKEDISKEFNIDKTKGNEFFTEQTKIDEDLFLSTILSNQQEVKLEKSEQNILIQKIANLVGTGEDNVSYKRAIDRINRRQLDEIGTERSREKPLNILNRKIELLEEEKEELEKYKDLKYEIEENKNNLMEEILNYENEFNFIQEIKKINENEKIEKEKIKIKEEIKNNNLEKIKLNKNEINKIENENKIILEKNNKKIEELKNKKNKLKNKLIIIFILIIIINIIQFILIKNNIIKYIFLLTVPTVLIFIINKLKNKNNKIKIEEKNNKKIEEEINSEKNKYLNENNLLEKNEKELEKELNNLKNNYNLKINLEKEKIKNKYINKLNNYKINNLINSENINYEIEKIQKEINDRKIKLHELEIDKENIEPKLDNLSKIEEELVNNNEEKVNLKKLEQSMNLAKEILNKAYEEMKNTVTPKFTENLSTNISKITDGKYKHVNVYDENGMVVELENGNYVEASRLSVGTIDQLYLSLRLSMIDDLSEEKMPIILDEAFAYFDTERLKNILKYLSEEYNNRQIIILTCTEREKEIFEEENIEYNLINL
ncbi:MAG: AAA family ATPase [Clostridium sp.]|nr:AAA family ATPase [Clostridium sp.]